MTSVTMKYPDLFISTVCLNNSYLSDPLTFFKFLVSDQVAAKGSALFFVYS